MQKFIWPAFIVAILSGLAIGTQSSLINSAGKITGPALTGFLVNFLGGAAGGLMLIVIFVRQGKTAFSGIQGANFATMLVAGLLGLAVITGIAYALPKIGIAAGLSEIIAGQMVVAVLVDTFGLLGGEPIPLSLGRISGLGLLALGAWAILPKG